MNLTANSNETSSRLLSALQSAGTPMIHLDTKEPVVPLFEREEAMRFHPLFNLLGWLRFASHRTEDLDTVTPRLPG